MNNKGFSLIELIISLSLISIVLIILFNVLFANLNTFHINEDYIEIQEQGQILKDFIENKLYFSDGLDSIIDINKQKNAGKNLEYVEIKELRIKIGEDIVGISIDNKKKKMFFKKNLNNSGYEIGDYVEHFSMKSLHNGKGVNVSLAMKKNNTTININFSSYFRNYKDVSKP